MKETVYSEMDDYFKLAEHIAQKYNNRPPIPYPSSSPFYVAPYITCSWCNFVSFLDMISIGARDVIQSMEDKEKILVGLSQMKVSLLLFHIYNGAYGIV